MKHNCRISLTFLTCMLCTTLACAPQKASQPPLETHATYLSHTIMVSGETLGVIAKWYTGDSANWKAIEHANPGIKANRLRIGQQVNIPDALVIRREPFSQQFLATLSRPLPAQAEIDQKEMASMNAAAAASVVGNTSGNPSPQSGQEALNQPLEMIKKSTPDNELFDAVMFADATKIKELIAAGANANYRENDRPLLAWAAQNQSVDVVKALLEGGADINSLDGIGHSALMRAVDMGQMPIVKVLIEAKADLNLHSPDGRTALILAINNNNPEMAQTLLSAGANPNVAEKDGSSAALLAAQNNSIEIIKALGAAKADLNVANAAYTPLTYAISQENVALVTAILEAGANPNARVADGQTPLVQAINSPELVKLLLAAKADPNIKDNYGQTALMTAIQQDSLATVENLIAAGADVNARDANGTSVLVFAQNSFKNDLVELLRKKGATE